MVISEFNRQAIYIVIILSGLILSGLPTLDSPVQAWQSQQEQISAHCDSGLVLLEQGEYEAAYEQFRTALRFDRNNPHALLGIGRALLELPSTGARALNYLGRAVVSAPNDADAHYYLAKAYIRLGGADYSRWDDSQPAISELDRAIELNQSHPDAYFTLGNIYKFALQDNYTALKYYSLQLYNSRHHKDALKYYLITLHEIGNLSEAVVKADSLMAIYPDVFEVYPIMALVYWDSGNSEIAHTLFQKYFMEVSTQEYEQYHNLGHILPTLKKQRYDALNKEDRLSYQLA